MIVLENVTKKFGSLIAVDNLSMRIAPGEIFGLLGPNGAGKTTTIRMLTTLISPASGTIKINGYDFANQVFKIKGEIGVAPQHLNLEKDLSAYNNLRFHGMLHKMPPDTIKRRAHELLEYVGLSDRAHSLVEEFSEGMKRRLLIARALMHSPKILFLDEPTVGLDPQTRRKIWDLIRKMNMDGMTALLTTHYIEEAEQLCRRVGIIDHGRLVELGTPNELLQKVGLYALEFFDHGDTQIKFFHSRAEALKGAEGFNENVTIRESNLEDVFIEMTRKKNKELEMKDAMTIFLKDMMIFRRTIYKFMGSNLVSPILYLTAFGWGLGRHVRMEQVDYLSFLVPGIVALTAMAASFNGIAANLSMSRIYFKTFEEIQISPVGAAPATLGYALTGSFRGLLSSGLVLLVALFFRAGIKLNVNFFIFLCLTCFTFASLGVLVAMLIETHEDVGNFSRFLIQPMTFICGTFFSLNNLPLKIKTIVNLLPLTHASILLRMSALGQEVPMLSVAILAGYGVMFFGLALAAVKRISC